MRQSVFASARSAVVSRLLLVACLVAVAFGAKPYIDAMEHDIQIVNPQSFDAVIRKFRDDKVQCVLFYQKNKETKAMIDGWYNRVAKDLKGMVKVAALDCEDSPLFCKDQNVKTFPTILIFPPNPLPATPYTGAMEEKALTSTLTRMIPNYNIKTVTAANVDDFLTTHVAIPKVFLFTNKKGHPTIYKALSNHFKKEMDFGIINESEADLIKRFKVTKFPTVQVHRTDKKPETYTKKEMTYQGLYDFVNLFCEIFAKGGGFDHSRNAQHSGSDSGAAGGKEEAKPWLVQKFPEVTKASHGDVCFKQDTQGLCVIYLKAGGPLTAEEEAMLEKLSAKFTSHLADRGAALRWMWMDTNVETEWAKLFDVGSDLPNVAVFNPHKRLRFTKLERGPAKEDNVKALLDKIMGGDARFKMVPGQKLPEFANRAAAKKDEL